MVRLDPRLFSSGGLLTLGVLLPLLALAQTSNVYTIEQATRGKLVYASSCSGCHRTNLSGGGDAPVLSGDGFLASFGSRSTQDLYNFVSRSMPAGAPGSLSEVEYTNIVAYLLYANGAKAGSATFNKGTAVKVSSIADGRVPADAIVPPVLHGATTDGLTVKGTVKSYVDVDDETLEHPPDDLITRTSRSAS